MRVNAKFFSRQLTLFFFFSSIVCVIFGIAFITGHGDIYERVGVEMRVERETIMTIWKGGGEKRAICENFL